MSHRYLDKRRDKELLSSSTTVREQRLSEKLHHLGTDTPTEIDNFKEKKICQVVWWDFETQVKMESTVTSKWLLYFLVDT